MMHQNVILIALCIIFLIWILAVNIFKCVSEWIENRPETPKEQSVVIIKDYIKDSRPRAILVDALINNRLERMYLYDYDKSFEFASQVYYNKWVSVELSYHYYGILLIHITKKVYSMNAAYI